MWKCLNLIKQKARMTQGPGASLSNHVYTKAVIKKTLASHRRVNSYVPPLSSFISRSEILVSQGVLPLSMNREASFPRLQAPALVYRHCGACTVRDGTCQQLLCSCSSHTWSQLST